MSRRNNWGDTYFKSFCPRRIPRTRAGIIYADSYTAFVKSIPLAAKKEMEIIPLRKKKKTLVPRSY